MVDVAAQLREFIRLDRKHRAGGLPAPELERWMRLKRMLGNRFDPKSSAQSADRRVSMRVPTQLRIDFASVATLRGQVMTNLSRGGLFVATRHLLEIGTHVTLAIHIEATGEKLEVPTEVVSHNVGPHFEADARGMGMAFLDMDPQAKKKLEALYDDSLHRALTHSSDDSDE